MLFTDTIFFPLSVSFPGFLGKIVKGFAVTFSTVLKLQSFSSAGCHPRLESPSLLCYLSKKWRRTEKFMTFLRAFVLMLNAAGLAGGRMRLAFSADNFYAFSASINDIFINFEIYNLSWAIFKQLHNFICP